MKGMLVHGGMIGNGGIHCMMEVWNGCMMVMEGCGSDDSLALVSEYGEGKKMLRNALRSEK